jgi:hypothetical protein
MLTPKNWYRKETNLWAKFGKEIPFGRKFSSKHSVKVPAVNSTPSFGRRAVFVLGKGNIREYVMTWPEYKEGTN